MPVDSTCRPPIRQAAAGDLGKIQPADDIGSAIAPRADLVGAKAGALREIINNARLTAKLTLSDLTALSAQNDPYRLDTPANHVVGRWFSASSIFILISDGLGRAFGFSAI